MRVLFLLQALAALTIAGPKAFAQVIDFEMVDRTPDPPTVTVPIGTLSDSFLVDPNSAKKTSKYQNGTCGSLPRGSGPVPSPDTADAFTNYDFFAWAAFDADEPSGYFNTFTNLQASSSAYGYLGFTTLDTYDSGLCAAHCDTTEGCSAFNLYFERDPTLYPGPGCSDPPSSTVIKCVFWGGPVVPGNTLNQGQYRENFHVVITGSNGYISNRLLPIDGYDTPYYLGTAAIDAPQDCTGANTFMGSRIFNSGPFDPRLCAAACDSMSDYNGVHADILDHARPCRFFNTYLPYKNGIVQGQYCALYSESWDLTHATNTGQWRGSDHYTIDYSFAYSNSTDIGSPTSDCSVASPPTTNLPAPYTNTSSIK